MQSDLFHPPDPTQEAYATALHKQWQTDLDYLAKQGIIPPWIEIGEALQKDERRLLSLIADHCGYLDRGTVITTHGIDNSGLFPITAARHVDQITVDAGFTADGNALAVINKCIDNLWIVRVWDGLEQCNRLDLTERGRWMLDLAERDDWFSEGEE